MIFEAIEFATKAHAGQYRKGTRIPYITHPLGVSKILIENGCPEHVIVCGILHDTIEDTPVTFEEISMTFGQDVADLVSAVSEHDKSDTWENRKSHTIEKLKILSDDAVILTLADKLDNIRSIREDLKSHGEDVWHRFSRPKEKQKWYYESLATIFSERLADKKYRPLVECFRSTVEKVFG
jgi:(p)ppGpp synthase/HD superfamily hydrolase